MDGRVCRLSIDEKFNSVSNNKRNEILQNKDQEEAPEISEKFYFEEKHLSKVTCICYLEDLDYVISGGDDGIVQTFNKHGELKKKFSTFKSSIGIIHKIRRPKSYFESVMNFKRNTKKDVTVKQFQKIVSKVVDKEAHFMIPECMNQNDLPNTLDFQSYDTSELVKNTTLNEECSKNQYKNLALSMKYEQGPSKKQLRKSLDNGDSNSMDLSDDGSTDNDDEQTGKRKSKFVEKISDLEMQIENLKKKNNELLELCHMMEMD